MDTARKRGDIAPPGGLTELQHREVMRKADIAQQNLSVLKPYFEELKNSLREMWESLPLDAGPEAKTIKFELYCVKKLEQMMIREINKGKQSKSKLGDE